MMVNRDDDRMSMKKSTLKNIMDTGLKLLQERGYIAFSNIAGILYRDSIRSI